MIERMCDEAIVLDADEASLVDQISALERRKSAAAANQALLTAALVAKRDVARSTVPIDKRRQGLGSEVALARRDAPQRGNQHLGFALALVYEMPCTFAALQKGLLSEWRATILIRESAILSIADRRKLDAEICADPATFDGWGNQRFTAEAKKIAYRLDPQAVVDKAARAPEERFVSLRPAPDCMAYLSALLPMAQGVAVYAALMKAADTTFDGRSRNQVMADTLVERVTGRPADVPVPVDIGIVIDDDTLLGDSDEPADVESYGPVPADIARQMVGDAVADKRSRATLRRLYRHPKSGGLVAMESRSRAFPPGLARFIRVRDGGHCRTPYCDAPIRHTDHATPVSAGGATSAHNGNGRCAQCNYDKEAPGWTVAADTDTAGTHTTDITTPTGHTYRSTAPPLPGAAREPATARAPDRDADEAA